MDKGFNLTTLLHDILAAKKPIRKWQDFEELVATCCQKQDPACVRNKDIDPDITLSNGYGIEAKSVNSATRPGINLNSAAPDPNTYYVIGYYRGTVQNIAIVSGANFSCSEIDDIKKINTSLRDLSNPYVKYRTRVMWQMKSPFVIWGRKNFVVDNLGKVTLCN